MRVGIIGYGFVGKALRSGLNSSTEVSIIDPKLNTSENDLLVFKPEIIFICVPTPMGDDGFQDFSILNKVIDNLKKLNLTCPVVIKSTVLPDILEQITKELPSLVYNPEFLREKHANEDFIHSNMIVIGSKNKSSIDFVINFYVENTKCKCKNFVKTDVITASFIKYTINSFLATKVSFFNELYHVFTKSNTSETWNNFVEYLSHDTRLGNSHMFVPGHDGKFGFGGACLPKDSIALVKFAETFGCELNVLNKAIAVNNTVRHKYNTDQRESDQNINFFNKNI